MVKSLVGQLAAAVTGFGLICTSHAAAQTAPAGETAPPVEHASFHHLVFANDDVAVLDNRYPPGGDSGFHAHYRDIFAVVLQSVPSSNESMGQARQATPAVPVGTAVYSAVGAEPRIHRIVNGDSGSSRFIVVEIRRATPLGMDVSTRDGAPQYVQITDNPRLRAWRLILEPGQSVPSIRQDGHGIRIVVRGGLLSTIVTGRPDQTLALLPGDFAWQQAGTVRALRNDGAEPIEIVELELK